MFKFNIFGIRGIQAHAEMTEITYKWQNINVFKITEELQSLIMKYQTLKTTTSIVFRFLDKQRENIPQISVQQVRQAKIWDNTTIFKS